MSSWNDSLQALKHEYDISVWGHDLVGKSSLILHYIYGRFEPNMDFSVEDLYSKVIPYGRNFRNITILDTKGQVDIYSTSRRQQIMNTKSIVFAYSIVDRLSFEEIDELFESMSSLRKSKFAFVVVGLKSDLESNREVSYAEGERLAEKLGAIKFLECSAKYGTNIKEVFDVLISNISRRESDSAAIKSASKNQKGAVPRSASFSPRDGSSSSGKKAESRNSLSAPPNASRPPNVPRRSSIAKSPAFETLNMVPPVSRNKSTSRSSAQGSSKGRRSPQPHSSHQKHHHGSNTSTKKDAKNIKTQGKKKPSPSRCTIM